MMFFLIKRLHFCYVVQYSTLSPTLKNAERFNAAFALNSVSLYTAESFCKNVELSPFVKTIYRFSIAPLPHC